MRGLIAARGRAVCGGGPDDGNALVESVVLGVLLMVPLFYIILAVLRVQASAYGVTEAAREAGRAYVESDSSDDAYLRACAAATIALRDQIEIPFDCAKNLKISCVSADGCSSALSPGDDIHVEIDVSVDLPLLPSSVFGRPTTISLSSTHDEIVDKYRGAR